MRTEFIDMFAELNATELEQLTKETKETVATAEHAKNEKPVFTAANLWRIHNMRKTWQPGRSFIS